MGQMGQPMGRQENPWAGPCTGLLTMFTTSRFPGLQDKAHSVFFSKAVP
jgi:hypothetical protein